MFANKTFSLLISVVPLPCTRSFLYDLTSQNLLNSSLVIGTSNCFIRDCIFIFIGGSDNMPKLFCLILFAFSSSYISLSFKSCFNSLLNSVTISFGIKGSVFTLSTKNSIEIFVYITLSSISLTFQLRSEERRVGKKYRY